MIAVAHQSSFSPLPSFQDVDADCISSVSTAVDLDEESGLLDFATPPAKPIPMRRSMRKISRRQSSSRTIVKRTLSQKRRREHVSFRDDNLVETKTIPSFEDECKKEDLWYNPQELNQEVFNELKRNWQVHMNRGWTYPLEDSNLTWRGLEEHAPSPAHKEYGDGVQERLEKIQNHVMIVLAIANTLKSEDNWQAELCDRSSNLSKSDRDDAIERAQKDAYEALRELGAEHGPPTPPPGFELALAEEKTNDNSSVGVLQTLVTWFCL